MDMFEYIDNIKNQPLKITKPIRLIELFGGIGSQYESLRRVFGDQVESYRYCDFDKYAVNSYNAEFGTNYVPTNIMELKGKDLGIENTDKYTYILTYSYPCQDISNAGKQRGFDKSSGTRSGLLWEVERLLQECKTGGGMPQILLMENVKALVSNKFMANFQEWINTLESFGYKNNWKVMNACEYTDIPQNRERCYMISWLDHSKTYTFPEPKPTKYCLQNFLEEKVDEKLYLKDDQVEKLIENGNIKIEQ